MRFVVQRKSGDFVVLTKLAKGSEATTYALGTRDAVDATDFGDEVAARAWLRINREKGEVRILNPDGSWPMDGGD